MRKKILSFVFAAALLAALAVPLFGGGTALAVPAHVGASHCQNLANGQVPTNNAGDPVGVHIAHNTADVVHANTCAVAHP